MRILIEEHQYPAELVDNIIIGLTNFRNIHGKVSVNHVGYYFNPELGSNGDTVFILPKVLMEDVQTNENGDKVKKEMVFGKYAPEDIIDLQKQSLLEPQEYNFIYELSVWIYRAIVVYRDANPTSDVVQQQFIPRMSQGRLQKCNTYLDILLALLKFNRENQDFFFFVLRNIHAGYNKINWERTISHTQAYLQDGAPVYLKPVNRKRQINFDEELLVIYFSILNYLNRFYGFPVSINVNFDLITGQRFESYMKKGLGRIRLLQIRHKYFSDKALYLWELCFAFFDQSHKVMVETKEQEYILVKNFNIVFEAIIDELIGTDHRELPPRLAEQSDGKMVDHLWIDNIILPTTDEKSVYYIGDSKYYKHRTPIGENSIYKQFTYARNVIQWSFDALMGRTKCEDEKYKIRLRDDRTEGYNVIPNFFISATVDFGKFDYTDDALKLHQGENLRESYQFAERLFDRDTLLLSHYDVNFLFVLAMYARNEPISKARWKKEVRKKFRERVQTVLNDKYAFYALKGYDKTESENYINTHFQELLGKIYRVEGENDIYTFAVEKKDGAADSSSLDQLRKYFYVAECSIQDNPHESIEKEIERFGAITGGKAIVVNDNRCEQTAESIRQHGCYAIGLGTTAGALSLADGFLKARYLVLHKLTAPIVFRLKEEAKLVTEKQLGDIPRRLKDSEIFLLFEVLEEDSGLPKQITQYALNHPEGHSRRDAYVTEIGALFVKETEKQ